MVPQPVPVPPPPAPTCQHGHQRPTDEDMLDNAQSEIEQWRIMSSMMNREAKTQHELAEFYNFKCEISESFAYDSLARAHRTAEAAFRQAADDARIELRMWQRAEKRFRRKINDSANTIAGLKALGSDLAKP